MNFPTPVLTPAMLTKENILRGKLRYLLLLLYWPLYGVMFYFVERVYQPDSHTPIYCFLDDYIPFVELFLIPYLFWFIYLIGMHVYTALWEPEAFKRLMWFIIFTYSVTIVIYLLFPNCQELRPQEFPRDNFLTRFMAGFYQFDTNTNVCPSLHVVGSMAVYFTSLHCKGFKSRGWRLFFVLSAVLISISTVFLKQHSILDVLAAIPLCALGYIIAFRPIFSRRRGA